MASNLMTRFFLFQFLLIFSYYHYQTLIQSANTFKDNVKEIAEMYPRKIPQLNQLLKKPEIPFKYILYANAFLGITSILGFRLSQILAGYFTICIAIIYCNPFKTVYTNFRRLPTGGVLNYIPSIEFICICALGIGMIANAFIFEDPKKEDKRKIEQEKQTSN